MLVGGGSVRATAGGATRGRPTSRGRTGAGRGSGWTRSLGKPFAPMCLGYYDGPMEAALSPARLLCFSKK